MKSITKKDVIDDVNYLLRRIPSKPWDSSEKKIYRHKCAILMESICGMTSNFIKLISAETPRFIYGDERILLSLF